MKGFLLLLFSLMVVVGVVRAEGEGSPRVVLQTSKGDIVVELDAEHAPVTVENFLGYVGADFYDGTVFHRVIDGFMIQGGGFTAELVQKETGGTIRNEANNGRKNKRGTLAMARRPEPHSATAQFFINTADNSFLDHQSETPEGWGYAVFGEVVSGMEVVEAIAKVDTGRQGSMGDVPEEPVIIENVRLE